MYSTPVDVPHTHVIHLAKHEQRRRERATMPQFCGCVCHGAPHAMPHCHWCGSLRRGVTNLRGRRRQAQVSGPGKTGPLFNRTPTAVRPDTSDTLAPATLSCPRFLYPIAYSATSEPWSDIPDSFSDTHRTVRTVPDMHFGQFPDMSPDIHRTFTGQIGHGSDTNR